MSQIDMFASPSAPPMEAEEWAPGIVHRSLRGYPACGAKQRPIDVKARFSGDVVVGDRGTYDVDCAECLAS